MASIFTRIINREIPAYIIAENEKLIAFLDAFPVQEGHTLVVPKKEIDDYFDLTDEEISEISVFAKKIATAIKSVFSCQKVAMSVIGLEVPHAHIHLIPINQMNDYNFDKKLQLAPQRMLEIRDLIINNL